MSSRKYSCVMWAVTWAACTQPRPLLEYGPGELYTTEHDAYAYRSPLPGHDVRPVRVTIEPLRSVDEARACSFRRLRRLLGDRGEHESIREWVRNHLSEGWRPRGRHA